MISNLNLFKIQSSNILALGRISPKTCPPELFVSPARIVSSSEAFKAVQLEVPPLVFKQCPTGVLLKEKHS
jgi:hypothetical protein